MGLAVRVLTVLPEDLRSVPTASTGLCSSLVGDTSSGLSVAFWETHM